MYPDLSFLGMWGLVFLLHRHEGFSGMTRKMTKGDPGFAGPRTPQLKNVRTLHTTGLPFVKGFSGVPARDSTRLILRVSRKVRLFCKGGLRDGLSGSIIFPGGSPATQKTMNKRCHVCRPGGTRCCCVGCAPF